MRTSAISKTSAADHVPLASCRLLPIFCRTDGKSGAEIEISAQRNEKGEKWCFYGDGHWADPARFYKNATKSDGLNGICIYHQGKVDQHNKSKP